MNLPRDSRNVMVTPSSLQPVLTSGGPVRSRQGPMRVAVDPTGTSAMRIARSIQAEGSVTSAGASFPTEAFQCEGSPKVRDVAEYILRKKRRLTAMKLQKLVYYSQAWSLVWDDAPLFPESIEAWANGPVVPVLWEAHRGKYDLVTVGGSPEALNPTQRETVDAVLATYGDKTSHWLSELTHSEDPWREARRGIPDGQRGSAVITWAALADYYSSL